MVSGPGTSPANGDQRTSVVGRSREARAEVVREMVREDRAAHPGRPENGSSATTASADAVEALRRSVRDLKHDVRMLKVGVDKQSQVLDRIAASLERAAEERSRAS